MLHVLIFQTFCSTLSNEEIFCKYQDISHRSNSINVTIHNSYLWLLENHIFLKDLRSHIHGFLLWQLHHQHLNCRLTFTPVSCNTHKPQKHRDRSQHGCAWQDFKATLSLEHQEVLPYTLPGPTASRVKQPYKSEPVAIFCSRGYIRIQSTCNLCIWNEAFESQRIGLFSTKVEYSCCLWPSSCCCTSEHFALLRTPD